MDDSNPAAPDPEERALTGHPDHPPAEPDFAAEDNRELLREQEPVEAPEPEAEEGRSPGEKTSLPGYGG